MKVRPVRFLLLLLMLFSAGFIGSKAMAGPCVIGDTKAECSKTPNCVSTKATSKGHVIDPLRYSSTQAEAMQKLVDIVNSLPRTQIITNKPDYLYVTFTSLVFRFVDDVEFFFDDAAKTIHFRSASRVGYSDLGANRKRMEKIRQLFQS